MTTPLSEPHAHVLDPSWSQEPVPGMESADATLLVRIHAACLDDCGDCLTALAHQAVATADNTAVVMSMGFRCYSMVSPSMRPKVEEQLEYATAFISLMRRIREAGEKGMSTAEVLEMVRALGPEDRWEVVDAAIQLVGLYTQALQEKEPKR